MALIFTKPQALAVRNAAEALKVLGQRLSVTLPLNGGSGIEVCQMHSGPIHIIRSHYDDGDTYERHEDLSAFAQSYGLE